MDRTIALFIVTWGVMLLLYLGLARVLFELRGLRSRVDHLTARSSASSPSYPIDLPSHAFAGVDILLVAESSCARCWAVLECLIKRDSAHELGLLTYEDPAVWSPFSDRIQIIQSETSWASMNHLSLPVLLRLDRARGTVSDIALPVGESDLKATLDRWDKSSTEEIN